jgi:hypothetical protein
MSIEDGASAIFSGIQKALAEGTGLLVGRNGTIELTVLLGMINPLTPQTLEQHAGIWPPTNESIKAWADATNEAVLACDVIVEGWFSPLAMKEKMYLSKLGATATRIPLRSLEPYYVSPDKRWTSLLSNQDVAIVNSFATTAMSQTAAREEIWPTFTDSLLPSSTRWIPIVTGYCPVVAGGVAGWPEGVEKWQDAVQHVVDSVTKTPARIAIVGCGGLGMVIAHELKKRGLIVVVLGGATQVLFGIKGGRWATHPVISSFWNDAWVYPSAAETPNSAFTIEKGCYWGPAVEPSNTVT